MVALMGSTPPSLIDNRVPREIWQSPCSKMFKSSRVGFRRSCEPVESCVNRLQRAYDTVEVVASCLITPYPHGQRATDGDKYGAYGKRDTNDHQQNREVRDFTPDAHVRKPFRTTESHEMLVWPLTRCE